MEKKISSFLSIITGQICRTAKEYPTEKIRSHTWFKPNNEYNSELSFFLAFAPFMFAVSHFYR